MVAETVKSYPYPALPLISPELAYSSSSCASALIPQGLQSSNSYSSQGTRGSGLHSPSTPSGLGAGGLMGSVIKDNSSSAIFPQRKQREFIPDSKKDDSYWDRRRRNNEAAKRSREKRRFNDMILEQRVLELSKENHFLRAKLNALESKYHVNGDGLVDKDQVLASMPQAEQILALTRRSNISLLSIASPPAGSLLSASSSPSHSIPPTSTTPTLQDDDRYIMPQYSHPDTSPSMHTSYGRSQSPDNCSQDNQPSQQPSYSPEPSTHHAYYSDSPSPGTALNLSARSSRSPINMDYCEDQGSARAPSTEYAAGSCLPHKLRHKTAQQQLSNGHHHHALASIMRTQSPPSDDHHNHHHYSTSNTTNASSSALYHHHNQRHCSSTSPSRSSPTSSTSSSSSSSHLMFNIKREVGEESPGSSDDRDSGVSVSPTLPSESGYSLHHHNHLHSGAVPPEEMELDSDQLRAQVERLTNEVHNIKHLLNRSTSTGSNSADPRSNGRR